MAEFDPISAALIGALPPRVLTPLSARNATPTGELSRADISLDSAARSTDTIDLDATSARTALAGAVASARVIVDTLAALRDAVAEARTSSLVGSSAQLTVGGTRVSRLNIQAEARRALADINALVAAETRSGINLIASDTSAVEVQTSRFGGAITLAPQPLDSRGLGFGAPDLGGRVAGFRALTDAEIAEAEGALTRAHELASRRLLTLQTMEERLAFASSAGHAVRAFDLGGRATLLARGSVIDLVA